MRPSIRVFLGKSQRTSFYWEKPLDRLDTWLFQLTGQPFSNRHATKTLGAITCQAANVPATPIIALGDSSSPGFAYTDAREYGLTYSR